MVKIYDNIIPSVTCKKLLDLFEKNEDYHEYINDNHCPCFTQLNLNELSKDTVSTLIPYALKVYQRYKEDTKSKYIPPFKELEEFRIKRYYNNGYEKFADHVDRVLLKIPIIGDILNKSCIARFSRTLATMFAAGTPLVEAMESVAGASGNVVYKEATYHIRDEVSTGSQMNTAMQQTGVFPNMVVQMVAIGEESGAIDTMLLKVAEWYEQEVDDAVDTLTSLLEPLIMSVLGVIIGGLVIAMYLPIFKMGQVV